MLRWNTKPYLYLLLIPLVLSGITAAQDFYSCKRVIDGDTIIVNIGDQEERVRLIGVDTPETVHPQKPVEYFGKEASKFTKSMVEGKRVRLEYDWQRRDKYGRLLAYVYLEDGTLLNAEIIKQGYGFAYTRFPFKYLEEFRQYERDARNNSKGLWKENQSVGSTNGNH
jgi:micrococcal nuclease